MIDFLFIIALPFRAMPNQKMEAALSVQQNNKMADRSGLIPSPLPPLPCVVTKLLIFEEKGWVISDTIFMLGEQNNIVWTPNRKLLLNLTIRARKLSELNPI